MFGPIDLRGSRDKMFLISVLSGGLKEKGFMSI